MKKVFEEIWTILELQKWFQSINFTSLESAGRYWCECVLENPSRNGKRAIQPVNLPSFGKPSSHFIINLTHQAQGGISTFRDGLYIYIYIYTYIFICEIIKERLLKTRDERMHVAQGQ